MAAISVKDPAPDINVADIHGNQVHLSDYADSYLLLAFLRYSECPWCNLALHRLVMEKQLLQDSNCRIIVFIQSTQKDIQRSIVEKHKAKPSFPIIADPDMKWYGKYGVKPGIVSGLGHHIRHLPAWVHSVYKEGFTQKSINGGFFLAPAAFLLSPNDQKIIRADYNADFYEHESFTKIYETIGHHSIYGSDEL